MSKRGHKIVVIEGCDKAGKSTLAKALSTSTSLPITHFPRSDGEDLYDRYCRIIESTSTPFITDRFYPSELVYGPLLRGFSRISHQQALSLHMKLNEISACFVLCYASENVLVDRFREDSEDITPVNLISSILARYELLAEAMEGFVPVYRIDTSDPLSYGTMLGELVDAIREA